MTDQAQQHAAAFGNESQAILAQTMHGRVNTDADYANAGQYLLYVKQRKDALKQTVDFFVKPLEEQIKRIKAFFAPASTALDEADRQIRAEMNRFQAALAQQRAAFREEAAKAAGGGDVGAFAASMLAAQQPSPQVQGVSTTTVYKYEVLDVDQLPDEFVVKQPNKKKLLELARASKGTAQVPGVRFWQETNVVARG